MCVICRGEMREGRANSSMREGRVNSNRRGVG